MNLREKIEHYRVNVLPNIGVTGRSGCCGCTGRIDCLYCSHHRRQFDPRLEQGYTATHEIYFVRAKNCWKVSHAIFTYEKEDIIKAAGLICEDQYYDEGFFIEYFARGYPPPKCDLGKVSNREILSFVQPKKIPEDYPEYSPSRKQAIQTMFLCRQDPKCLLATLPREVMFQFF